MTAMTGLTKRYARLLLAAVAAALFFPVTGFDFVMFDDQL
jgi:hypothetical protein